MNKLIKGYFNRFLRITVVPVFKVIATLFFKKEYLCGKYFDDRLIGWLWVWRSIWLQKVLGFNRTVPWPVSPFIRITEPENIIFDQDDLNNFQTFGCYFQSDSARIVIGKGTYIAPNVGIITSNHDPYDPDYHLPGKDIIIGEKCWIGMNSVILPGVTLGPRTVVGAGSVVTKSFPEGNCVIAGVPAKLLSKLNDNIDTITGLLS